MKQKKQQFGFSLIEIMLVMVIMTTLAMMALSITRTKMLDARIERTADQMQQIMQAATSYYIDTHGWPEPSGGQSAEGAMQKLIEGGYLPVMAPDGDKTTFPTPWGLDPSTKDKIGGYAITVKDYLFQVTVTLPNESYATVLKGKLPLAEVIAAPGKQSTNYTVTASINVPGYDYAHAKAVNYASIIGHGECVPQPACPKNMTPHIYASVATFAGYSDADKKTTEGVQTLFVVARGDSKGAPTPHPRACDKPGEPGVPDDKPFDCKDQDSGVKNFWRICMTGNTSTGPVFDHEDNHHHHTLNASVVTKCTPGVPV